MSVTFEVFRGSKEGKIVADKTTRTLQANEVYIETSHSGLCGTDEHFLHSGMALGHEGVGRVSQVGRDVTTVKIGQRVGFGYTHYVCGTCEKCLTGMASNDLDSYEESSSELTCRLSRMGSILRK